MQKDATSSKVEGAKTNNHSKPTPINTSRLSTLYYIECFPMCRIVQAHGVMVLGAISDATS